MVSGQEAKPGRCATHFNEHWVPRKGLEGRRWSVSNSSKQLAQRGFSNHPYLNLMQQGVMNQWHVLSSSSKYRQKSQKQLDCLCCYFRHLICFMLCEYATLFRVAICQGNTRRNRENLKVHIQFPLLFLRASEHKALQRSCLSLDRMKSNSCTVSPAQCLFLFVSVQDLH